MPDPPPPGIAVHPTTSKHTQNYCHCCTTGCGNIKRECVFSWSKPWQSCGLFFPPFCDICLYSVKQSLQVPGSCEIAHSKTQVWRSVSIYDRGITINAQEASRGEKRNHATHLQPSYFSLWSSPFVRLANIFFFTWWLPCRLLKSPGCREITFFLALVQYLFSSRERKHVSGCKSVYKNVCVFKCVWWSLQRAAPSPLFVTLEWNAYSQSLHCWHSRTDVIPSLIHNIARCALRCCLQWQGCLLQICAQPRFAN